MNADAEAALACMTAVRRLLGEQGAIAADPLSARSAPATEPAAPVTPADPNGIAPHPIGDVLRRRRSHYSFGGPPDTETLQSLLSWGALAPSAGGLRSLSVRVVTDTAISRYDPHGKQLRPYAQTPAGAVGKILTQPEFAHRTTTFLALVADPRLGVRRYGARHYRTLHVEAGVLGAHLCLVAETLGLATCLVSGFDDDGWHELLRLESAEFLTLVIPVAVQPDSPPP